MYILCCVLYHQTPIFTLNYRKDARLPVQLQRAMAAEAEAAREARAKVTFVSKIILFLLTLT